MYGAGSPVVDEHVSHESVGAGAQFAPNMQAGPHHLRLMRPGMCWAMAPVGFLSVVAKEILCGLAGGVRD